MPLSAYAEKLTLDWLLGGAAATRPAQRWVGLSYGTPSSTSASELGVGGAYTRVTLSAAAAASPGGSASNAGGIVFAAFTAASTIRGWQIWDTQGIGAGNMLFNGTLTAATLPASASQFTCGAGNWIGSAV